MLGQEGKRMHQSHREVHGKLLRGRWAWNHVRVREEAQHHAVATVGDVYHSRCFVVLDEHATLGSQRRPENRVDGGRKRGAEVWIFGLECSQLGADPKKALVV